MVTKYSVGKDGKTAAERLKGQTCTKPMARFGEYVHYMPLDAANTDESKISSKMRDGIWRGVVDRTDETIIGTTHGVIKCRTIKRRPEGQQWSADAIEDTKGSAQQPIPGTQSDRIPTGIVDNEGQQVKVNNELCPCGAW